MTLVRTMALAADPIDRDTARELARRELEKPLYQSDKPSWLARVWERFTDWLDGLFSNVPSPSENGPGGGWVSWIIIILILMAAIALVFWVMRGRRIAVSLRDELLEDRPSTAKEHRDEAARLAVAGDWAQAIRERLRAIARDLEERVILQPRPGRTANELAVEAGAELPECADELTACVRIFDDVWYGDRPGTPEGYQRLTDLEVLVRKTRPRPLKERDGDEAGLAGAAADGGAW